MNLGDLTNLPLGRAEDALRAEGLAFETRVTAPPRGAAPGTLRVVRAVWRDGRAVLTAAEFPCEKSDGVRGGSAPDV